MTNDKWQSNPSRIDLTCLLRNGLFLENNKSIAMDFMKTYEVCNHHFLSMNSDNSEAKVNMIISYRWP